MKIFIDIGHPAHVHYFRNFIKLMQDKGHEFFISARDKEVTHILLDYFKIPFVSRGKGGKGIIGKFLYLFIGDFRVYRSAIKYKPDLFLSVASPYAAHAAFIMRRPHIALDDTETAKYGQFFYIPFTNTILNPQSFKKNIKIKQIRFNSFMELFSLHPRYFIPDPEVLKELPEDPEKPIILLRFVSWNANHDLGQRGLTNQNKKELIKYLSTEYTLFISSEGHLPMDLKKFEIKIAPEKIHHVMAYAILYIGEGATMAAECAMLGTPSIYVNSINAGTLEELEKYGLIFGFRNSDGVLDQAVKLLNIPNLKEEFQLRRQKMLEDKIDATAFLIWFVENYPNSVTVMKENPEFQNNFK